eukprot:TRINITY_DN11789_c0_g1_i1.p1 TRINITY_DN11789_c0_g1~~TRINITY_DN11789_c0_g1_i1.p1  ORF type:complete len:212 (+),score=22.28 TRINITY_DN11789_c0_g1_i1:104-739(+)
MKKVIMEEGESILDTLQTISKVKDDLFSLEAEIRDRVCQLLKDHEEQNTKSPTEVPVRLNQLSPPSHSPSNGKKTPSKSSPTPKTRSPSTDVLPPTPVSGQDMKRVQSMVADTLRVALDHTERRAHKQQERLEVLRKHREELDRMRTARTPAETSVALSTPNSSFEGISRRLSIQALESSDTAIELNNLELQLAKTNRKLREVNELRDDGI